MILRSLRSIILFVCGATLPIQADLPTQPPTTLPSYQNVYVMPQAFSSSSPIMSSSQNTTTTTHQCIDFQVSFKFPSMYLPTMSSILENIAPTTSTIQSWLWNYKWNIAATGAIYVYCTTYYQLHQINNMLQKSDAWCLWKEIMPLGHLTATAQQDLLQQLQLDINKKYYRSLDIQNTQAIFTLFLQETNLEMKLLDSYLALYDFYHTLHMSKFLPLKHTPEIINERKARLQFVIDLFIKWYLQP